MNAEIVAAILGAVIGCLISELFALFREHRKDKLETKKLQLDASQNRPEMEITDYKDYISRPGCGIKQKCDIELFVAHIERVTVEGTGKHRVVCAHYKDGIWNPSEWCCVIYTLKNVGKTSVSVLDIICNFKKDTCIFPCNYAGRCASENLLDYSYCYDKKIRPGDSVTLKLCYHQSSIIQGAFSASLSIGMQDDNDRRWIQLLFAPQEKIYDSRIISQKEYNEQLRVDTAEECFKNPGLW